MPYATAKQLADALHVRVIETNEAALEACLEAAAIEIDHECDWFYEEDGRKRDVEPDALLNRVNLARAVEWWKANDAAFGVIGFDQVGALRAPRDGFARHALNLRPRKELWGIA